jgi:hypothetical protein
MYYMALGNISKGAFFLLLGAIAVAIAAAAIAVKML